MAKTSEAGSPGGYENPTNGDASSGGAPEARSAATTPDSARVQRVRAGVYKAGRAEVRRVGSFWYVVGEPYTAYLSLLDALAFGVTP